MKKDIFLVMIMLMFVVCFSGKSYGIYWDDNQEHVIDYFLGDRVITDSYDYLQYPGTSVIVEENGSAEGIHSYGNSSINIMGGWVSEITALHSSKVSISSGEIRNMFFASNSSSIDISGGFVGPLQMGEYSNAVISGGYVPEIWVWGDDTSAKISGGKFENMQLGVNGVIFLDGEEFMVNGVPVIQGSGIRDYAHFEPGTDSDKYYGVITGTLSDGSLLNSNFTINVQHDDFYNKANIVIVPEPASLLLLGLGGLMLRKKIG